MRRLVTALVAAVALGGIAASFVLDAPLRAAVKEAQGKSWKRSPEARLHGTIRKVGDWPWLMAAGACGFMIAWRLGNRRWMQVVAAAMLASTVAGMLANTSRLTTGRTRPRSSPDIEQGFYGPWHDGKLLIGNSAYNSFPSGHVATAFGLALPFFAGSWLAGVVVTAGAVVVLWSSIALGAHHLSDCVVSVVLAVAVSFLSWRVVVVRGPAAAAWVASRLRRR